MKVVITDCNFKSFVEEQRICEANDFELVKMQTLDAAEIIAEAQDADALLVQYAPITAEIFEHLDECKILVRYGIGVDNIDLEAAKARGVAVCNVPDYGRNEVADHASALALALARQLPAFDRAIRNGEWPADTPTPMDALENLRFGAIGAGKIGMSTLTRMAAFNFKLAAYDPFVPDETLIEKGIVRMTLDEIFEHADILSLHLPLNKETHHIVNTERLKQMKSSAVLINTSRGGLINQRELAAALQAGEIAFAGIDVHEAEPLEADHPLRDCPNALLTPHMAYFSDASITRLQRFAAEEVERCLLGHPLRCQVA